ncbi:MAG: radical SAM family heme chaperone HemW [Bacteroidetes bacterium]|nr:radical SAM family heme chaperone HemW [Bacteroidota bacterium]
MSGIYIHIPFCRQACHYCDFHFSTSLKSKQAFLNALKKEIYLQKDYLTPDPSPAGDKRMIEAVNTIYFGGGTPSVLSGDEIKQIVDELSKYFSIDKDAEITLEANPDDLSKEKLKELSQTPINRLSIGIQSFRDEDLKFLNRIHDSSDAIQSVKEAQEAGFKNITIDLIYGIQTLTNEQWEKNIQIAFSLDVLHISCYSLTVEPRTALAAFIKKGKMQNVDPQKSAEQFETLMNEMRKNNFIHYEISNFCKKDFYSKHNTSYWKGTHYLGLGPSAHSYNGNSRQWNVSSNHVYINSTEKNILPFEKELLTQEQKFNEYIMTSLRTIWGIDLSFVEKQFGNKLLRHLLTHSEKYLQSKEIISRLDEKDRGGALFLLADNGKLFADKIASDLFVVS